MRFLLPLLAWLIVSGSLNANTLSSPPPLYAPHEKNSVLPQIPKVNVVTGEYCEEACDLIVAGSQPLSIRRFYNHLSGFHERIYGHWRINPETFMLFNFEPIGGSKVFAGVGEHTSGFFLYEKPCNAGLALDNKTIEGFTSSALTGKHHPLNASVTYIKGHQVAKKGILEPADFYWWEGKVKDGSGRERLFKTDVRQWPQAGQPWPCRTRRHRVSGEFSREYLDFAAPYQTPIVEERCPNGNVIRYEYEDCNASIPYFDHDLPTSYALRAMRAYSATGVLLGSIEITYSGHTPEGCEHHIRLIDKAHFQGSDGRNALYGQPQRTLKKHHSYDTTLCNVEASGMPVQSYQYLNQRNAVGDCYMSPPYLCQVGRVNGCFFETTYDSSGKVAAQSAPVGPRGEKYPIARYEYRSDHTAVYDGEGNKTIYRYDAQKRMCAVEKYQEDALYLVERFTWDSQNGNLLTKKIEDAAGKLFLSASYRYDKNHNVIEESVEGANPILRSYSDDGFNLKLSESHREGKVVTYSYLPQTDLLTAELVRIHGEIVKRTFHFYNRELGAVLIKTIVDDGKSENPDDLASVSYRHVLEITPKSTMPCLGLPEEVREYAGSKLLKKVCYIYHPSGKVASEAHYDSEDQHAYTLHNTYDAQERLIATTDALGFKTTFEYDSNFNCIACSGPRGDQRKEWHYDLADRPIKELEWQSDGSVLTSEYSYDKNSRLISSKDPSGYETRYVYDALGRQTAIHYPDGAVEKKEYDILGNVVREIDARGFVTHKSYNFRGQPITIHHSDGTQEEYSYTDNGMLSWHRNAQGVETRYSYDLLDHLIRTEIGLSVSTTTHSPFRLISETDPLGVTTFYDYDAAGRKIAERKEGREVYFSYDHLGLLNRVQEGDSITHFIYDVKGQLVEKGIEGAFLEKYGYDEAGNRISKTTCVGTSSTLYNTQGEPLQITDPLGNVTKMTYTYEGGFTKKVQDPKGVIRVKRHDARRRPVDLQTLHEGQLIQRTEKKYDLAGNQIESLEHIFRGYLWEKTVSYRWDYGPRNRLERLIEAGEKETHYLYDSLGRLATLLKPDGRTIQREYDDHSRLARFYGEGIDYRYSYDLKNRIITIEDTVHHTTLVNTYDSFDHILSEKLDSGIEVRREFDPYGKRTALYLPDGSSVDYSYQGPFLKTIARNSKAHTYVERNLSGRPTQVLLASMEAIHINWDPLLRCKSFQSSHFSTEATYDEVGNLTHYRFKDPLGEEEQRYRYDALNQLSSENEHSFDYDSLRNRRSHNGNDAVFNDLMQLTSVEGFRFIYDKNGNLTSDGVSAYTYDVLDRLISVTHEGTTTHYRYDALNRRIARNNDLYIWDGQQEIGTVRDGEIKELRILGEGKGAEIGAAVLWELDRKLYIPINDYRGSLVVLLSEDGIPVETRRYAAFGESVGNALPWTFASKRYDSESGLIYFGKRYYNPKLGRWITPDPQGFQDGPNLYAYVSNNPLLYCDPYGLLAKSLSEVHNFGDAFGYAWYKLCSAVEWYGRNLVVVHGPKELIEGIGRFGRGDAFYKPRERMRVVTVPGIKLPNVNRAYMNGILTNLEDGKEQTEEMSKLYGGIETDLLFKPSQGFANDMIDCVIAKLGFCTAYDHMCAEYSSNKLAEDSNKKLFITAHSHGAIRLNNVARLLKENECMRMSVDTYGGATIISKDTFKQVNNYVSKLDGVPCTSAWNYVKNVCGMDANVTFLTPTSKNPLTEHYLLHETYMNQLIKNGKEFQREHFHD